MARRRVFDTSARVPDANVRRPARGDSRAASASTRPPATERQSQGTGTARSVMGPATRPITRTRSPHQHQSARKGKQAFGTSRRTNRAPSQTRRAASRTPGTQAAGRSAGIRSPRDRSSTNRISPAKSRTPAARPVTAPDAGPHSGAGPVIASWVTASWRRLVGPPGSLSGRSAPLSATAETTPVNPGRRITVLLVVMTLVVVAVVGRLTYLQVVDPTRYRELSADQRIRTQTLAADRGTIYDRSGVELAISAPQRSVFIDPLLVTDPAAVVTPLAALLDIEPAAIEERVRAGGRFLYVARQVSDEIADEIAGLGLDGVGLIEEPKRFLPSGAVGRSLIGLTDIDGNGLSGLEQQYSPLLTGTPGNLTVEKGPDGRTIPVGSQEVVPALPGQSLVLSIDRSLQYEAEKALANQVQASAAAGGVAVVSNPTTGEVLAMANVRRIPETGEVVIDTNNQAITTSYEPGSVMKMITASAAVQEGLIDYSTMFTIPPSITIGEWEFSEHTPLGTVTWPLPQLLSNSSNVGTIQIAEMLGEQRLHDYLLRFGLGAPTGLDFPNEQSGSVPAVENWWGSSMASISLGQSVSVTPLQMLMAYNVVANGGVYVPPRLVLETIDSDGTRRASPPAEPRQVVSEDTADMMNMMLRGVVAEGTGTRAAVAGYSVAGKTGTARKAQPNGTYVDDYGISRYQATFVGFVPAESPSLSIIVMIDEPGDGHIYGGSVAAPVFAEIAQSALRILDIAPPATDRAERFSDALPPEAQALYDPADGVTPRLPATVLGVSPEGRVRALPVGATHPESPSASPGLDTAGSDSTTGGVGQ